MKVHPITNNSFGAKNTYLEKSKRAATKLEKDYFESLHNEALARKAYMECRKADLALEEYTNGIRTLKDAWSAMKILVKTISKKLDSAIYLAEAHEAFPNRFVEPDDKLTFPWRYYQLKSFSKRSMPLQIKSC